MRRGTRRPAAAGATLTGTHALAIERLQTGCSKTVTEQATSSGLTSGHLKDSSTGRTVELPALRQIRVFRNSLGDLGVVEEADIPEFDFRRFYFLTGLPDGAHRGAHAHKRLRQLLICLQGQVTVELTNGTRTEIFRLKAPEDALAIPPGWWRDLRDFGQHSVIGVIASAAYDEADYIRDWDAFIAWTKEQHAEQAGVPFLPLSRQVGAVYPGIGADLERASQRAIRSGHYIGGAEVEAFEAEFARYCGTEYAVGVANGLEAIELALMAVGVGPGDEVVMPAHTFIATAFAVERVGATVVLADIDLATGLLDVDKVARVITAKTKAIIPVHLYGQAVDMAPLQALAEQAGIILIEDAAQAHGARYNGRRCGSLGAIAAFSFYPTKNLGALGDAGAVTTSDPVLASRVRHLANYGSSQRYNHTSLGMNSRLDPIQAASLRAKLPHLDKWNERRQLLASRYLEGLAGIQNIALPMVRENAEPVWHVFQVRVEDGSRETLQKYLGEQGIGTNIHYPLAVHEQPCYAQRQWKVDDFPNASRTCRETLSLPLDPFHTDDEIERVIKAVQGYARFRQQQL